MRTGTGKEKEEKRMKTARRCKKRKRKENIGMRTRRALCAAVCVVQYRL